MRQELQTFAENQAWGHPDTPEVIVRHGEHRLSLRYEVVGLVYDVNNNKIEIVTGEQK